MLISRRPDHLQLVTHPDHGRVAGALFEHWGNDAFAVPAAREALMIAAIHHDDGWAEMDGRPLFNEQAKRPAHFLEVPLEVNVPPYRRGVDSVYARDQHAGVLVSIHWSGLYRTRWGLQGGDNVGHPLAGEVVAEQQQRWAKTITDAWGGRGLRSEFEAATWHAYEVLQALDFVSLALCLLDLQRPEGREGQPMPATLPRVDQPTGGRTVPAVPTAAGGDHPDVQLWVAEPGRVALDPFPFAAPFELDVPVRRMEDRPYADAGDASAAFAGAALGAVRVSLTPA